MSDKSEREEALFRAGKIAGEPAYSWKDNKKNLRAELDANFTIMGGGENLDEMNTADQVWEWILENFDPKEKS